MSRISEEIKHSFKRGSLLTKLIYINVGLFVPLWFIDLISSTFIAEWIAVQPNFKLLLFRPWTIITYMFTHVQFLHLLFNMLWLFWFGRIFAEYLRPKQLFAVYVMGGIVGGLIHVLSNEFLTYPASAIGASASVMAIVLAISAYRPDHLLHLIFVGPVKLKYLAIIAVVIDLMGLASNMSIEKMDGVAHTAHLGGALYGLWFGYQMRKGKDITRGFNRLMDSLVVLVSGTKSERKRNNMKVQRNITPRNTVKTTPGRDTANPDMDYNARKKSSEAELNRILDKISASGYNSLSDSDKDFLFRLKKD